MNKHKFHLLSYQALIAVTMALEIHIDKHWLNAGRQGTIINLNGMTRIGLQFTSEYEPLSGKYT